MSQSYIAPFFSPRYLVASGTDTYTGSVTGYVLYSTGDAFEVLFTNANTGAATININSLGPIALKKNGTIALAAGDIAAGSVREIVYDGTNFQVVSGGSSTSTYENDFRLSLVSGTPVPVSNATYGSAQSIYCTPYSGSNITLYNGSAWITYNSAEFSVALGTLTNNVGYDVFCYANSNVPTLELLAWTNGTTRATNLVYQDGILCKTGALTRRYLGSFYNFGQQNATVTMTVASPCVVTYTGHGLPVNAPIVFTTSGALPTGITAGTTYFIASTGAMTANTFNISATVGGVVINTSGSQSGVQTGTIPTYTEDSINNRLLFNYYNALGRPMHTPATAADYTYTSATNQINDADLDQRLYYFNGLRELQAAFEFSAARSNSTTLIQSTIGIGVNSLTNSSIDGFVTSSQFKGAANEFGSTKSSVNTIPPTGLVYYAPLVNSVATGTCTFLSGSLIFTGSVPS